MEKIKDTGTQKMELIEQYIRRQAVLDSKFPEILEAPKSIQDEYFTLNTIIDSLRTSRREVWGETEATDGVKIDGFVKEKYEKAISALPELRAENGQYISKEDEETFQFPEIDFEGLEEQINGMKSEDDRRRVYQLLMETRNQVLPEETLKKLNQLNKKMWSVAELPEHDGQSKTDVPVTIKQSKFAEIYGKAKGKVKEVFSKLKSLVSREPEKENTVGTDEREGK